jgi:hypothetical protein
MGRRGPAPRTQLSWRGREIVLFGGFPAVHWPEHPMAVSGGLVPIHRALAVEKEGRLLGKHEAVRFRDGNVWNSAPENLVVENLADHFGRGKK